jgi:uncharacterized protein with NRDE domain
VDFRSQGTWLGLNVDTGNFGFITNYENQPRREVQFGKYRRGMLLTNFLKEQRQYSTPQQYKRYLQYFLDEGDKFNGTNIWLTNLIATEDMYFAHN